MSWLFALSDWGDLGYVAISGLLGDFKAEQRRVQPVQVASGALGQPHDFIDDFFLCANAVPKYVLVSGLG
jgi:hypothetical protein